jgi:hypothetical protein
VAWKLDDGQLGGEQLDESVAGKLNDGQLDESAAEQLERTNWADLYDNDADEDETFAVPDAQADADQSSPVVDDVAFQAFCDKTAARLPMVSMEMLMWEREMYDKSAPAALFAVYDSELARQGPQQQGQKWQGQESAQKHMHSR